MHRRHPVEPADDGATIHSGSHALPWGSDTAGLVRLRGPSGQILKLEGAGEKSIQWAPLDRRALELEFRAWIYNYGPNPGFPSTAPVVRWRLNYGHGQQTYQLPIVMPFTIEGGIDAFSRNILPARGLCLRMSTREFQITFASTSKIDNSPPYTETNIQVSMQPVYSSLVPLVPRQHYSANLPIPGGIPLEPFPPEATEFRLFDPEGQPYPPASGNVSFIDLGGQLLAAPHLGLDLFANFVPIPVHAAAWGPPFDPQGSGLMVSAEYR